MICREEASTDGQPAADILGAAFRGDRAAVPAGAADQGSLRLDGADRQEC